MTMTSTDFDAWITALTDGSHDQTKGKLFGLIDDDEPEKGEGFCCLGVVCDIRGIGLDLWAYNTNRDEEIPLARFGGVEDQEIEDTPLYPVLGELSYVQRQTLAIKNDSEETFEDIAAYLVAHRSEFVTEA